MPEPSPRPDQPSSPSSPSSPASRPEPWPEDGWSRSWRLTRASLADRVPVAVRARWRVSPAAATAAVGVACAVLLGAGARYLTAPAPTAVPLAPAGARSGTGTAAPLPDQAPTGSTPASSGRSGVGGGQVTVATLVVDVVGRVRRPGIVRLPAGSRVVDAVAAAGGAAPDAALELLNLARPVADGEQILVPAPGQLPPAVPGAATGSGPGAAAPAGPLDLNRATEAELDALPGIGPVLAGRIVAWRAGHGRFSSVDELGEVAGIGDRLLEQLRPLVAAGAGAG